ncbi:MAG: c-type cytochrome domain-containing protein [Saprospiraceae bacterium]|nr:c-type cytochrome domain-containing protein [Saprospiraceae bacterium]
MRRYTFQFLCLASFSILGFLACKHDPFLQPFDPNNPDPTTNTGVCNPDSVYFQNQILPILVSNCTESGCHNAQDHQEGIVLDSYQSLVSTVENATQNDWNENKLMRALLENDLDDRMPPPPKSALPPAQIDLLKIWLAQGAQNNACDENFGGCDVSTVKFSTFIMPLVQVKCQGCHSGNNPQGNLKLVTYSDIKTVASNGKLYASLTRTSNWMPNGGAKLDDCSLQKIQAWIGEGALEN